MGMEEQILFIEVMLWSQDARRRLEMWILYF